ncbi:hypothetical protein CYMTET_15186 [Cymbomonas tetramitiformis]|uniref:Rho termination factor-like N-terminal domain-containing protein n=1 Tax=Cymbomonas tetramitiformis TaxID=36881 RepID=A0AAE0L9E9_9CHLO|nr:hypothetical protein CYMTET_15186 [Cymbomonas tetramitiformis]
MKSYTINSYQTTLLPADEAFVGHRYLRLPQQSRQDPNEEIRKVSRLPAPPPPPRKAEKVHARMLLDRTLQGVQGGASAAASRGRSKAVVSFARQPGRRDRDRAREGSCRGDKASKERRPSEVVIEDAVKLSIQAASQLATCFLEGVEEKAREDEERRVLQVLREEAKQDLAELEAWDRRFALRCVKRPELLQIAKESGLRRYSRLRKAQLIEMIENSWNDADD